MRLSSLTHEFMFLWLLDWKLDPSIASWSQWSMRSYLEMGAKPIDLEKRIAEEIADGADPPRMRQLVRWKATLLALRGELSPSIEALQALPPTDVLAGATLALIFLTENRADEAELAAGLAARGPEAVRYIGHQVLARICWARGDAAGAMTHAVRSVPITGGDEVVMSNGLSLMRELAPLPALHDECLTFVRAMRALCARAGRGAVGAHLDAIAAALNENGEPASGRGKPGTG